jgi:hypothetical protein
MYSTNMPAHPIPINLFFYQNSNLAREMRLSRQSGPAKDVLLVFELNHGLGAADDGDFG